MPARLTDKEKEALRAVLALGSAKLIARALDITEPAVKQRLAEARRKLGVASSREAAILLAQEEGQVPYPSGTGSARQVADQSLSMASGATGSPEPDGASLKTQEERLPYQVGNPGPSAFGLPFPTERRPCNDLNPLLKIGWIILVAAGMALLFAALGVAFRELDRVTARKPAHPLNYTNY